MAGLRQRAGDLQIATISANLLAFKGATSRPPDVILCMGDTLTHLPDGASVASLLAAATGALAPGGIFAATFRDYVSAPLQGNRRFIPVRSDANRILTCFLEYQANSVLVHDLLHEAIDGGWQQRVSCYSKLRLDPAWVAGELQRQGLEVRVSPGPGGMITVRAVTVRR